MQLSTISYLSFIHGVITDVHDRPWVCLGGSVQVLGTDKKQEDGQKVLCKFADIRVLQTSMMYT